MKLETLMRAVWDRGYIVTATRMQHDSVVVRANIITDRQLELFDTGTIVGVWARFPAEKDQIGDFGGDKKDLSDMVDFLLGKITMEQFYERKNV